MIYFYLFVPLFALFYFALRGFIRLDLKISLVVISLLCASFSLFVYKGLGGEENFKLVNDKEILNRFIADQSLNKEQDALEVDRIILEISSRDEVKAGEIYLLAKRLKGINENTLASLAFEQLYRNFPNELGGSVLAEYAQTMFLKEERSFR